jgi:hypothetical protein
VLPWSKTTYLWVEKSDGTKKRRGNKNDFLGFEPGHAGCEPDALTTMLKEDEMGREDERETDEGTRKKHGGNETEAEDEEEERKKKKMKTEFSTSPILTKKNKEK